MEKNTSLYWNKVLKLHREGYNPQRIQSILLKEGIDEIVIAETLCKLKLKIYKERKDRAVIMVVVGACILLAGFLATVFLFHNNHDFDVIMYGVTTIGMLVMGYGAYEVLSKS